MNRWALWAFAAVAAFAQTATIQVDITPGHAINSFDPDSALGSSIDVLSKTGIDKVYTPHIVQEALSAGWGPITYRNNTELRMAAWHWTRERRLERSGPQERLLHRQQRTQGAAALHPELCAATSRLFRERRPAGAGAEQQPLEESSLPDQQVHRRKRRAASAVGGDGSARREAASTRSRSAGQILTPRCTRWTIGWDGLRWVARPTGNGRPFRPAMVKDGKGGTVTLKLAPDSVCGAIRARLDDGVLQHLRRARLRGHSQLRRVRHSGFQGRHDRRGRRVFRRWQDERGYTTSSIDPWHSATDVNATGSGQHTGFDVFFTSGLTNNLPAMIPVTMLYGTPDDSAAQIAYIKKRGYPDRLDRDGRGTRRQAHSAGGLRRALHSVGEGDPQGGPHAQTGRSRLRGDQRGHQGVARRAGHEPRGSGGSSPI